MNHVYRVYFQYDNEAKTKIDLGIFLERKFSEGKAWTRAMQLVPYDGNGMMPYGRIVKESLG